ncbi:MAG: NADH-quinone oxidoreductase subunit C [Desulforudis sp.]|jgi:Ni,Fe-hydrogenase III component G|nr:NADH-quinone oxidoreductase subunit C [Clostridia bacterium]MDQ7792396.1 NADH-quinone oxidoreductase subunit C [Clostridia bacterium]RJX16710.1 MAG: NADH-quinone oxidoreductase subunit C [Desulforudis sp.]
MQQVRVDRGADPVISPDALLKEVELLASEGARFTTMICLDLDPEFEIIYLFQKPTLDVVRLRVRMAKDEELPSISSILLGAVLMENEIREFFGVKIINLAIDFKCRMLLSEKSLQMPLLKVRPKPKLTGGGE